MITKALFDPSDLSDRQLAIYEQRRAECSGCNQGIVQDCNLVTCDASRRSEISLVYGQCPLRKWTGDRSAMPDPPAPPPDPAHWMAHPPVPHRAHITAKNSASGQVSELFVYGFPGLYAGANTELHHQILLWRSMGIGVHLIPGDAGYRNEPLYQPMIDLGVVVHDADEFSAITPGAAVFGFCNVGFLQKIDQILEFSHNTVFVNCMTWLFELEEQRFREGKLAALLYQNQAVQANNESLLRELNPDPCIRLITFQPYFDCESFPFVRDRDEERFTIGRISRQDADKFAANTLEIWDAVESSRAKRGIMLGFGDSSVEKIGQPGSWIETYQHQSELSQREFYRRADIILQPMDTTENWPRIGLEAMASGSVLIVDSRGGWRQMIQHGITGFLCDDEHDFVRHASQMALNPSHRIEIANAARERLDEIAGKRNCTDSWRSVFGRLNVSN